MIHHLMLVIYVCLYLVGYIPTAFMSTLLAHQKMDRARGVMFGGRPYCHHYRDEDASYCRHHHSKECWRADPRVEAEPSPVTIEQTFYGMVWGIPWPVTLIGAGLYFSANRAVMAKRPSNKRLDGIEDRIAETERQAEEALRLQQRAQG